MTAMSDVDAVSVQNGCISYGRGKSATMVLHNLNMNVHRGVIYGLLGASGCGKTTLLSCIAGRLRLNSGELKVFGGVPGKKGSAVPGPCLGYMPQEVALVSEMNVRNVIYYFGWLFGMSSSQIAERYEFLAKLLELPPGSRLIKNLSGGQQRRVSFAAALVQSPELLILDEPTVGLDPVLRQSIWNYLVKISHEYKTTIIITTHYIEEAIQADTVGLLREGTLLAEMAPELLITTHGCDSLEEVFLTLSQRQTAGEHVVTAFRQPIVTYSSQHDTRSRLSVEKDTMDVISIGYHDTSDLVKLINVHEASFASRMKALVYKDGLAILRNKPGMLYICVFPILLMIMVISAVGSEPKGYSLGIVNDELPNCPELIADIRRNGIVSAQQSDGYDATCYFYGLSCLFIDKLNEEATQKVFFPDYPTAMSAAKNLLTSGTIYFPRNFSRLLQDRFNDGRDATDEVLDKSEIKVRLDMSNYVIGHKLKKLIYDTYDMLTAEIAIGCNISSKLYQLPIHVNNPIYGNLSTTHREFLVPGFMVVLIFFLSAMETATIFSAEKCNGVWLRNLVAGATASESILSHILCQTIGMLIQLSEVLMVALIIFNMECKGNVSYIVVLLFLQSLAGTAFGLLVASISKNTTDAMYGTVGSFLPYALSIGAIWPREGSPLFLQYLSQCFPGTLALDAIRNILYKGWGITHPQVFPGFLMSVAWILGEYSLSVWLLRK